MAPLVAPLNVLELRIEGATRGHEPVGAYRELEPGGWVAANASGRYTAGGAAAEQPRTVE